MGKLDNFKGKQNTNGFKSNLSNINRKGRPWGIKKQIQEFLDGGGEMTIPPSQVDKVFEDGSVRINLPIKKEVIVELLKQTK